MAGRFVFDTNVFRYSLTDEAWWARNVLTLSPVTYASVVLSELRRAAQRPAALVAAETLRKKAAPFLLTPDAEDWWLAAEYLATLLPKRGGQISAELLARIRKEQNDALIAISAWRKGHTVVTCDADFEPIRKYMGIDSKRLRRLPAP